MSNIILNIVAFITGVGIGTIMINIKNHKRTELSENQELMIYQVINDILSLDLKYFYHCRNLEEFTNNIKQSAFTECNSLLVDDDHDVVFRSLISMKIEDIIDNDNEIQQSISDKYKSMEEKVKYDKEEVNVEEDIVYEKTDISDCFY